MKLLRSPLNYTGNKYRILPQIFEHFPKKIGTMLDLFCGGATVGMNVDCKKIIFVDSNEKVIQLLETLANSTFENFLLETEAIIKKYNLSYSYKFGYKKYRVLCHNQKDNNGLKDYNKTGFENLKSDYNLLKNKTTKKANFMLYLLMIYGFNNDIRFNSEGDFNLPIGKTDLNKNNINKVKDFIQRMNTIEHVFVCCDFDSRIVKSLLNTVDFVYMDPPYLVGNAVYNSGWNNDSEYRLLSFVGDLINKGISFGLSNVIEKIGKRNEPLYFWCKTKGTKISINHIEYDYKSSNYHKILRDAKEEEVLITNGDKNGH